MIYEVSVHSEQPTQNGVIVTTSELETFCSLPRAFRYAKTYLAANNTEILKITAISEEDLEDIDDLTTWSVAEMNEGQKVIHYLKWCEDEGVTDA